MTPATTPADGLDLPKRLEEWANGPMFLSDTPAVKAILRIAANRIRELERATPSPGKAPEPVAWFEAEETTRGADLRDIINSVVHSTRWHWQAERPKTNNPVWPVYASPGKAQEFDMFSGNAAFNLGYAKGREDERASPGKAEAEDAERLDYLDQFAVIAKPGQPIRDAIDAAMKRDK